MIHNEVDNHHSGVNAKTLALSYHVNMSIATLRHLGSGKRSLQLGICGKEFVKNMFSVN